MHYFELEMQWDDDVAIILFIGLRIHDLYLEGDALGLLKCSCFKKCINSELVGSVCNMI